MIIKKILIGHEWGFGMGHLAWLLPIARVLTNRNHQIVFFLHYPRECATILAKEKLPINTVRIRKTGTVHMPGLA